MRLFGGIYTALVEYHIDDAFFRIIFVDNLQKFDEFIYAVFLANKILDRSGY